MLRLARFGVPALLVVAVVLGAAWPSLVRGAVRTWDGGAGNGLWSSAANWSGDLLPGAGDTAQFDATNTGDVSIDANISVQGIAINAGYTGTITQAAGRTVSVGTAGFIQGAGAFVGGDLAITITNGVFTQTAGSFTSTSGILTVPNAFTISGGSFAHNNGTVAFSTNNADDRRRHQPDPEQPLVPVGDEDGRGRRHAGCPRNPDPRQRRSEHRHARRAGNVTVASTFTTVE